MADSGMANDIWRSSLSSHLQTIDSHYYNITDSESWPVAGLLVLLDSNARPVRSELHLYEDLPSHIQEAAVRQSRLVLQERYRGRDPVPLRILHTAQIREAMDVRLNPVEATGQEMRSLTLPSMGRYGLAAIGGALLLLVILIWGGSALLRSMGEPDTAASPPVAETQGTQNDAEGVSAVGGASENDAIQPDDSPDALPAGVGMDGATPGGSGELPPSRNARADIQIGMRVQILPGFGLTLRSEAGAQAGEVVGFMANEQQALVLGGPEMRQGETDTIVWWLVELDDGTQAWAAANTSETTLLVPVD